MARGTIAGEFIVQHISAMAVPSAAGYASAPSPCATDCRATVLRHRNELRPLFSSLVDGRVTIARSSSVRRTIYFLFMATSLLIWRLSKIKRLAPAN
jgi:hypothetical protein